MVGDSVIIIGAGAAGLSAAYELSRQGVEVLVLEARKRLGGRIFTQQTRDDVPVELGAEFVHGKSPALCDLLEKASLDMVEVPDRHWLYRDSKLVQLRGFWEGLEKVFGHLRLKGKDKSFGNFLEGLPGIEAKWRQLARDFVEGFDAARIERISVHGLAKDQEASERIGGDEAFRVTGGYGQVVEWLGRQIQRNHGRIQCGMKVASIRWEPGSVQVEAQGEEGRRAFEAAHAIVTLPLGVLKSGDVKFEPELKEKQNAIDGLEMGQVVKIGLKFHSRFWPKKQCGFIHGTEQPFPTWWTREGAPLLTGWAGGPKAEELASKSRESIIEQAMDTVARIFNVEQREVEQELDCVFFHDWTSDPFTRGAYTYVPVGMLAAQQNLSRPLENTLFFAGEAAVSDEQLGMVHGALASGKKAARQILGHKRRRSSPAPQSDGGGEALAAHAGWKGSA